MKNMIRLSFYKQDQVEYLLTIIIIKIITTLEIIIRLKQVLGIISKYSIEDVSLIIIIVETIFKIA